MCLEEKICSLSHPLTRDSQLDAFTFSCRMWWTITGTFGNILPIDWSKSYARKMHMPALNLNEAPVSHER